LACYPAFLADGKNLLRLAASHAHPVAISDGGPYRDSYFLVNGQIWSMEGVEERSPTLRQWFGATGQETSQSCSFSEHTTVIDLLHRRPHGVDFLLMGLL
jgi:hypothetical protein